jgi:hypothetical protein
VPDENIIGEIGAGFQIASSMPLTTPWTTSCRRTCPGTITGTSASACAT